MMSAVVVASGATDDASVLVLEMVSAVVVVSGATVGASVLVLEMVSVVVVVSGATVGASLFVLEMVAVIVSAAVVLGMVLEMVLQYSKVALKPPISWKRWINSSKVPTVW